MVEQSPEFEAASAEFHPSWDSERSARLYAATLQRARARHRRRRGAAAVFSVASIALLIAGLRLHHQGRVSVPFGDALADGGHTLRLADGSTAMLVGGKSELEALEDLSDRVTLRLVAGRAHFDVVPNPARSFMVEVPPYRVRVIGTIFDVERGAHGVRVEVTRGHVRVDGPSGSSDLLAGQSGVFSEAQALGSAPSAAVATASESDDAVSAAPAPALRARARASEDAVGAPARAAQRRHGIAAHAHQPRSPHEDDDVTTHAQRPPPERVREPILDREHAEARPVIADRTGTPAAATANPAATQPAAIESWRSLSRSGQYDAAFESLRNEPVVEEPSALMDAADAARLSGHPQDAVQYLARVARRHPSSPLAPLAAFTLGRVYLEELGEPAQAAEAFALSRALAPSGSMAQDALAREVEALSKAGNAHQAYVRAQEYLQRYPGGRRHRAVQLYGGVE